MCQARLSLVGGLNGKEAERDQAMTNRRESQRVGPVIDWDEEGNRFLRRYGQEVVPPTPPNRRGVDGIDWEWLCLRSRRSIELLQSNLSSYGECRCGVPLLWCR